MTGIPRSTVFAALGTASVAAQIVGAKATSDALLLTSLGVNAFPAMLIVASACSLLLIAAHTRWAQHCSSGTLLQAAAAASGILFLAEWALRFRAPAMTSVILFLHTSSVGPLLVSGLWSIAADRSRAEGRNAGFGRTAIAASLGGLIGALTTERVAATLGAPVMLLVLAGFQFLTMWLVSRLIPATPVIVQRHSAPSARTDRAFPKDSGFGKARSSLRDAVDAPHVRQLAVILLLSTAAAAMLDYLFKVRAVEAFGTGDRLLRFFALYYAATSLATFIVQAISSPAALERFGAGLAAGAPAVALFAGSLGSLLVPGLASLTVARAGESISRGFLLDNGYDRFPVRTAGFDRTPLWSMLDVGVERLGEAFGAGLIRLSILITPAAQYSVLLCTVMIASAVAAVSAGRLTRWYADKRGHADGANRRVTRREIRTLRSGDRRRVIDLLSKSDVLPAELVAHVIPLLGVDQLADAAFRALRRSAEPHFDRLCVALDDHGLDAVIRGRLARVLSACTSQRAVDVLQRTLDDPRFNVRFQSARSLAGILGRDRRLRVDRDHILAVTQREVSVARPVWENRRLADAFALGSTIDGFSNDHAGHSLAHVYTLLSLILPKDSLLIAFGRLHRDDEHMQGAAIEHLEGELPPSIRQPLWSFLLQGRVERPAQPSPSPAIDPQPSTASALI